MRFAFVLPLVAALAAAPSVAADRAAPPSAEGWQRPSPEQMAAHRAAMQAERATDIALLLGLRADQRPALDGFLAQAEPHGMHDHHGLGDTPHDTTPDAPETTLARLDSMSRHIDARDAEAKQRIEATRRFYAGLTPDQQKRFDAMAQLMHGHLGHDGMGEHRRPS